MIHPRLIVTFSSFKEVAACEKGHIDNLVGVVSCWLQAINGTTQSQDLSRKGLIRNAHSSTVPGAFVCDAGKGSIRCQDLPVIRLLSFRFRGW
jgi:hypothetical protein